MVAAIAPLPLDNDGIQSNLRLIQGGYDDQLISIPDTVIYGDLIASFFLNRGFVLNELYSRLSASNASEKRRNRTVFDGFIEFSDTFVIGQDIIECLDFMSFSDRCLNLWACDMSIKPCPINVEVGYEP